MAILISDLTCESVNFLLTGLLVKLRSGTITVPDLFSRVHGGWICQSKLRKKNSLIKCLI